MAKSPHDLSSSKSRCRRGFGILLKSLLISGLVLGAAGPGYAQDASPAEQLAAFIDDFVEQREHGMDSDLSADSFAEELRRTRASLARLSAINVAELSLEEQVDWKFARSILRGEEIEQEAIQSWRKDPRVYMQFAHLGRAVARPGDPDEKAEEVLALLNALPEKLKNGRKNLQTYIPRFQELSVFMAEGASSIFQRDVPAFASSAEAKEGEILKANRRAQKALNAYIRFLKHELPQRPEGHWAIGKTTYDALLKEQQLVSYDSDALYEFGWEQFEQTIQELEAIAKRIDPSKTWRQLAVEIKNDYPDPDQMIEAHQIWVEKSEEHIREHSLIPIPWKQRVDVVPRAEYLRKYSYYGNFSRAREVDDEGVFVAQWMINPFEHQWDEQTKNEYLVEHDYGVIIVTAPHETYGGHHTQALYQLHNPRKLRRTNGISIFSEGWGLYNEQLMRETGFFPNDRIVLRQLQLRLWRNARVIWDVGIHTGKMSYEEAISLLADEVGFLRWAAQLEVDGSAQSPVYKIGYFLGMTEILEMRADYKRRMGDDFSLSDFHERLLKVGNMPPALMRISLMDGIQE